MLWFSLFASFDQARFHTKLGPRKRGDRRTDQGTPGHAKKICNARERKKESLKETDGEGRLIRQTCAIIFPGENKTA